MKNDERKMRREANEEKYLTCLFSVSTETLIDARDAATETVSDISLS